VPEAGDFMELIRNTSAKHDNAIKYVRPSTSWFIQTAVFWFVTPCRVTNGCQCYGGTHCLHLRGL